MEEYVADSLRTRSGRRGRVPLPRRRRHGRESAHVSARGYAPGVGRMAAERSYRRVASWKPGRSRDDAPCRRHTGRRGDDPRLQASRRRCIRRPACLTLYQRTRQSLDASMVWPFKQGARPVRRSSRDGRSERVPLYSGAPGPRTASLPHRPVSLPLPGLAGKITCLRIRSLRASLPRLARAPGSRHRSASLRIAERVAPSTLSKNDSALVCDHDHPPRSSAPRAGRRYTSHTRR